MCVDVCRCALSVRYVCNLRVEWFECVCVCSVCASARLTVCVLYCLCLL
jgi:hypothetical protein